MVDLYRDFILHHKSDTVRLLWSCPAPMKIHINPQAASPVFQQIVEQIHFAITADELPPGTRLPSIRRLATDLGIAPNTVSKAYRQLEFRGLLRARERSGYTVTLSATLSAAASRYQARGVSTDKREVHSAIDQVKPGIFPGAFCKVTEDFLSGNPNKCNVIHADGAGTKSIIAYLSYKESGDVRVFHGIAQDSIVMNLDDLLCVGGGERILISNTINRNAMNCPGEVISALIDGTEAFLTRLREQGVKIYSGGGETADVGDLTGTIIVDSCAVAMLNKQDIVTNKITQDLAIVGFSSTGKAAYEDGYNSGIGSNGLTSARHDILSHYYAEKYPETFDNSIDSNLIYCGPYMLDDPLPDSQLTMGEALLSPTRTYAPIIYRIREVLGQELKGIVHCSGGAQTKCLKSSKGIHYIKDNLFDTPPLFATIQKASGTDWHEMYQVFNMGHRMEVFVPHHRVTEVIDIAASFGVAAKQVGRTESSESPNRLTIIGPHLDRLNYAIVPQGTGKS